MLCLFLIFWIFEIVESLTSRVYQLNENFNMTYSLYDQNFIYFELTCATQGWCSIGFGSSMANADIICLSAQDNTVLIQDMISKPTDVNIAPVSDAQQNVALVTGQVGTNLIYGKFVRRFISDDPYDQPIYLLRQTQMIWAINYNESNMCATKDHEQGNFTVLFGLNDDVSWNCHYMCLQNCLGPLKSDCLLCALDGLQSFNGYCQKSDLDVPLATKEIIAGDFIVHWGYEVPGHIQMMFEVQLCNWFGLAFGEGMYGTDMVVFTTVPIENLDKSQMEYIVNVQDMYGVGNMVPDLDTMRGGSSDWQLLGYSYDQGLLRVKVQRLMDTGDEWDIVFNHSDMKVSYAFANTTDGGLGYHKTNRGVLLLELSQGSTYGNLGVWGNFVFRGHTVLNFVLWGVLSDIGILFARQFKSYPKYAKVHGMIFLFQSLITYFFAFSMISLNKERIQEIQEEDNVVIAHFIIGIIILSMLTFQIFFGIMVKNNLESLNGSELVYRLKRLHQICGYILYCFTKINVILGVEMYAPNRRFIFYSYLIMLFLIKITIEMLYSFEVSLFSRERISYHYVASDKHFIYDRLRERLNSGISRYELLKEFPKLRYVILREAIYDVSDFNHPGGQFIIEAIRGREIGRYFYGGQPVEKLNIIPHKHSAFAINYIETRYIGDHKNQYCQILYHDEQLQVHHSDLMLWKFTDQHKISNSTTVFLFQSSHFKVRQQISGVRWFGRYFYIKPYGVGYKVSERPYSIVLCLSEENMQLRQQIIDYFKSIILENIPSDEADIPSGDQFKFSSTLNFIIKHQPYSNNMSKFLHETQYKPYEITGPYGLGLELNEHSNGTHYIICNGTGVLPFLDLFDFLLKKAFYSIIYEKNGPDDAEKMNPTNEDYLNTFGGSFRLVLIGAFRNRSEFYGCAIIEDLYTICKSFGLNYFNMVICMTELAYESQHQEVYIKERFNEDNLSNLIRDPAKVFVCGSVSFEEEVLGVLKQLKIQKKFIVIV